MKLLKWEYLGKLLVGLLLLLQIGGLVALFVWGIETLGDLEEGRFVNYLLLGVFALDVIVEVIIISTNTPASYKIVWMFFVFVLPIVGIFLYLFLGNTTTKRKRRKAIEKYSLPMQANPSSEQTIALMNRAYPKATGISAYLEATSRGGTFASTSTRYFPLVDDAFPVIIEELKKAKHYIYLEFFIVGHGKFFDGILDVLREKAAKGLDVRIIYDDVGSLSTAPDSFVRELTSYGIKVGKFNPFRPLLDVNLNNRDHRKILIIDGHTAFSGGFNLADEYINAEVRFGHWKDNAILLKGKAVENFTYLFLSNWYSNFDVKGIPSTQEEINNLHELYSSKRYIAEAGGYPESDGFVSPYGDLPYLPEAVGERVYLSLLERAEKYCYIATPYFIIDEEVKNALMAAATRGVDVRILMPHIPDKAAVFHLSRSHYGPLLEKGIKIYEYTPGFVHEKVFIVDDYLATVGTINLDYRSLFLHLECGTFLVGCSCISTMKEDYLATLEKSQEITQERWNFWRIKHRTYWSVLKLLSPML